LNLQPNVGKKPTEVNASRDPRTGGKKLREPRKIRTPDLVPGHEKKKKK